MAEKRLLALMAHPDDESFGIGGTLARYAAAGVDVHVAIATDGAAGTAAEGYEEIQSRIVEVRSEELIRAGQILGVTLHGLGYRDSGMTGSPDNDHPQAFINADLEEATGRLVRLIREIRPQVIITHDETGGYFHPDHIQCWRTMTAAFHAASDPTRFPEIGPAPWQAQRLYYSAFANTRIKWFIWLMRLRWQDPTRVGRNKDIDLTRLGMPPEKIHAQIDYRDYWDIKQKASAEHGSQGGGGGFTRLFPLFMQKRMLGYETYQRAYPPVPDGYQEEDLFAGIQGEQ